MFVDVNRPWRHAKVTDQRTCVDFAMQELVDVHYPEADRISNWEQRRNAERARIKWLFTVDRARQKLGRAYPVPADLTSTAAAAA